MAANLKQDLPALGGFLHKQGYIHEVKSAISEFMQYGIGTEDVEKLITYAKKRGALVQKLKDLETLYKGFMDYIRGNFITTEETLDVLARSLPKSKLLPGSVVVFDGFTGFTPVQNRVIAELMRCCGEVIISLTFGEGEDPYGQDSEQKLFHLSKKTVTDLGKLASEAGWSAGRISSSCRMPGKSGRKRLCTKHRRRKFQMTVALSFSVKAIGSTMLLH